MNHKFEKDESGIFNEFNIGKLKVFAPYMSEHDAIAFAHATHDDLDFLRSKKSGGTSFCLLLDDYALLYSKVFTAGVATPDHFKQVMRVLRGLYGQGVHVAPILGYVRSENGKGIPSLRNKKGQARDLVIVRRAVGETLDDMRKVRHFSDKTKTRLAHSHHYDDVTSSFISIVNSPLKPDISRNNTLYDKKESYTFVDFNTLLRRPHDNDTMGLLVWKFLKSFLTTKGHPNERLKEEYYDIAVQEQRVLTTKLHKLGIREEFLDKAVRSIPELRSKSIDELFR